MKGSCRLMRDTMYYVCMVWWMWTETNNDGLVSDRLIPKDQLAVKVLNMYGLVDVDRDTRCSMYIVCCSDVYSIRERICSCLLMFIYLP